MKMTGGRALAQMVKAHGAELAFGMGGFQLLPFYEGVRSLGLRHVLINDERTGGFAADAAARVSGRPALCDATLGPGATNLVTPLAEATNAGVPMIVVTGDAHRGYSRRNMTQETRQVETLGTVAKEVIRVEMVERIPEHVRRAYTVATSGRPGPVVIDLPEDVSHGEADIPDEEFRGDPDTFAIPARRSRPDAAAIDRAAELIGRAERPMILAGGGIHLSDASAALLELVERQDIPVAHTLSGKGAIPCTHPLSVGLFGRYSRIANDLAEDCDCLIVVGCKLGEIVTKRYSLPSDAVPIIHLDNVAEEIGRWATPAISLWGDARLGLQDLASALPRRARSDRRRQIEQAHGKWRQEALPRYTSEEQPINVGRIVGELNGILPPEAVLIADGGFASHWTGLLYDTKISGRGFVAGRGLASIGYGLPGALGAKLAAPDRPVVALTGDGGFNMTAGDLETAVRARAGFTLIILNNAASGYVKALQHAVYGAGSYQSSDLLELDYARVANAYGCEGRRIDDPADLAAALRDSLQPRDVPLVLDVAVTRDPGAMLPGVDSRTLKVEAGDRPV